MTDAGCREIRRRGDMPGDGSKRKTLAGLLNRPMALHVRTTMTIVADPGQDAADKSCRVHGRVYGDILVSRKRRKRVIKTSYIQQTMKQEWKPDELRATAAEIREAVCRNQSRRRW